MNKEFTINEKQIIIQNLRIRLISYFKDYQFKLETVELGYWISENKNGDYWIDYTITAEVNNEKGNIKVASGYVLIDVKSNLGIRILDIEYPKISKGIKVLITEQGKEL